MKDLLEEVTGLNITGQLRVRLSKKPGQLAPHLFMEVSDEDATVEDVRLEAEVYNSKAKDAASAFRPLTEQELDLVVLNEPTLCLNGGLGGKTVEHTAPDGVAFRLRDVLKAVEETERQTRRQSEWFGGVDTHHIYFEGISKWKDGTWRTGWGS